MVYACYLLGELVYSEWFNRCEKWVKAHFFARYWDIGISLDLLNKGKRDEERLLDSSDATGR